MQILGYTPCHHFKTNIVDPGFPYRESRLWQQASDETNNAERQKILRQIYSETGCKSAVDYPTSNFIEELVELYPEAKVRFHIQTSLYCQPRSIAHHLTVHPWYTLFTRGLAEISQPDHWPVSETALHRSHPRLIHAAPRAYNRRMYYSCYLIPIFRLSLYPLMSRLDARNRRVHGVGLYGSDDDVEIYHRHNEHVRRVVPSSRLLEFDPKEGWEPLCQFLDVPIPTDDAGNKLEYPHVNDTETISKGLTYFMITGCFFWVVLIAATYGIQHYIRGKYFG